jgi:uncharacterized membrane protein
MESNHNEPHRRPLFAGIVLAAAVGISWHFLASTPAGSFAKIFSIGSSLCHQIPSHSFVLDGIQFPLCARCTGLYLGSLIGLIYAAISGKKAGIPKTPYLILMVSIFIIWGADGVNSLISGFLARPFLYQTTNLTRLVTGYGMGLVMSTALSTLFNATMWEKNDGTPILRTPLQVGLYILSCATINLLIISNNPFLFMLAAYLATFTALAIITLLYAVFWVIILKKENTFNALRGLWIFLIAGLATALLQITLLITMRNSIL